MNRSVFLLTAGFFLITLGFTGPHRFTTILFQEAGKAQWGFASLLLIYLAFALMTPFSYRVIHAIGPKITMMLAAVSYAAYVAVLPIFNPALVILTSIAVGVSAAFLWSAQTLYLVEVSEDNNRGLSAGIFNGGSYISAFLSVMLLGIALERLVLPRWAIFGATSLFGFMGIAILGLLKPLQLANRKTQRGISLVTVLKSPTLLRLSLLWWSMNYGVGFSIASMPLLLAKYWGIAMTGAVGSLYWLVPLFFSLSSGIISDKYGRESMLKIGIYLSIVGVVGLIFPGGWWLVVSNIIMSISFAILRTGTYAAMKEISGEQYLELVNAYHWATASMGAAIAIAIGMIGGVQISIAIMIILSIAILVYSLPLVRSLSTTRKCIEVELMK